MTTRMQTGWATAIAMGMAMAITAGAQAPPTAGQQSTTTGAQQNSRGTVTATGCLQRAVATEGTSSAASQAASGARAEPGGGYVLKNARYSGTSPGEMSSPGSTSPGSTGGTASAMPKSQPGQSSQAGQPSQPGQSAQAPGRSGREIRLSAAPSVSLSEHVGHQVSVTGTMTGGMDHSSASGRPDRPVSSTDKPSSTPDQPLQEDTPRTGTSGHGGGAMLTVTSLSMISSTCSPAS